MRVLITGAAGFAGGHLANHLRTRGHEVVGVRRRRESGDEAADLRDRDAARAVVARVRPDWIFHLAAEASVARSWRDPRRTIHDNVETTLNVLEAAGRARVLVAGSGEIYGPPASLPVTEDHELRPQNPYAVSKAAADLLARFYSDAHGVDVVRTRSFNHAGPGQSDQYVVSAFARQIAEAERRGATAVTVRTGELRARRDFTDVRDVVRAYALLLERAERGAYNVCSGVARSAADILAALAEKSLLEVDHETDPERIRKHEVMEIRGSRDKLTAATGWRPEIRFDQTLADTLDWWRRR